MRSMRSAARQCSRENTVQPQAVDTPAASIRQVSGNRRGSRLVAPNMAAKQRPPARRAYPPAAATTGERGSASCSKR